MSEPSLPERIRSTRAVQVSLVYLGACWFVLQFVGTIQEMLSLPSWIGPVTIMLLAVGLVVVLATAWVQSLSKTTAAEEAGDLPTDWEIAPADAVESLKAGRIPHLTWARAVLGGVVSISLAIGAAGGYVLLRGGGTIMAPTAAEASSAPAGVAVMPFAVSGSGLDEFGEGMVSLVSMNIDGVDGIRSVNPRTVMAAWERTGGLAARTLEEVLSVAASIDARYAVVGDAVSVGTRVRFSAELYDVASGESVGEGRAEGPVDDVLPLIDEMSIDLLRALVASSGSQSATGVQRLEGLVTSSVDALTAYLAGEALYRDGEATRSLEEYERAVEADSTFALAWSRIASVYGWIEPGSPKIREARGRAMANLDRLPPREVTLVRGYSDASSATSTPGVREALRTHVRRFPDDPEGWAVLSEHIQHSGGIPDQDEEARALLTPIDLDPGFAPYYIHALRYLVAVGDWQFFEYMELYRGVVDEARADRYQMQWDFFHGGEEERARAEAYYDDFPESALNTLAEVYLHSDSIGERSLELLRRAPPRRQSLPTVEVQILASLGRYGDFPAEPDDIALLSEAFARGGAAIILDEAVDGVGSEAGLALLTEAVERLRSGASSGAPGIAELISQLDGVVAGGRLLLEGDADGASAAIEGLGLVGRADAFDRVLGWSPMFLAEALARSGDVRGAIETYEGYVSPWRAVARLRLGELYESIGDADAARENYSGFLRLFREADADMAALVERGREGLTRTGG